MDAQGCASGKELILSENRFAPGRGCFTLAALSLESKHARIDKWLWSVRLFKTRALATAACRAEAVRVNEQPIKPARVLHADEIISVRQGIITRRVRFIAAPPSRVGAKLVPDYYEDLTPPEEYEKLKTAPAEQFLTRERGAGRPTKRERRLIDQLLDGE